MKRKMFTFLECLITILLFISLSLNAIADGSKYGKPWDVDDNYNSGGGGLIFFIILILIGVIIAFVNKNKGSKD
jgi:hypothetical protein